MHPSTPVLRMGLVNVLWASALTFSSTDYLEGIVCTSEDMEHFFGNITSLLLQREFGAGIDFVIGHRGI